MNTQNAQPKNYQTPQIESIKLDNEICLILGSPVAPIEDTLGNNTSNDITNDPFHHIT